jgi:hypothetical protein
MSEAENKYWEGEITNAEIDQLADAGAFYLESLKSKTDCR